MVARLTRFTRKSNPPKRPLAAFPQGAPAAARLSRFRAGTCEENKKSVPRGPCRLTWRGAQVPGAAGCYQINSLLRALYKGFGPFSLLKIMKKGLFTR